MKKQLLCAVCGSSRGGCFSLVTATPSPDFWCPLLEHALLQRGRRCDESAWVKRRAVSPGSRRARRLDTEADRQRSRSER